MFVSLRNSIDRLVNPVPSVLAENDLKQARLQVYIDLKQVGHYMVEYLASPTRTMTVAAVNGPVDNPERTKARSNLDVAVGNLAKSKMRLLQSVEMLKAAGVKLTEEQVNEVNFLLSRNSKLYTMLSSVRQDDIDSVDEVVHSTFDFQSMVE